MTTLIEIYRDACREQSQDFDPSLRELWEDDETGERPNGQFGMEYLDLHGRELAAFLTAFASRVRDRTIEEMGYD